MVQTPEPRSFSHYVYALAGASLSRHVEPLQVDGGFEEEAYAQGLSQDAEPTQSVDGSARAQNMVPEPVHVQLQGCTLCLSQTPVTSTPAPHRRHTPVT